MTSLRLPRFANIWASTSGKIQTRYDPNMTLLPRKEGIRRSGPMRNVNENNPTPKYCRRPITQRAAVNQVITWNNRSTSFLVRNAREATRKTNNDEIPSATAFQVYTRSYVCQAERKKSAR